MKNVKSGSVDADYRSCMPSMLINTETCAGCSALTMNVAIRNVPVSLVVTGAPSFGHGLTGALV